MKQEILNTYEFYAHFFCPTHIQLRYMMGVDECKGVYV